MVRTEVEKRRDERVRLREARTMVWAFIVIVLVGCLELGGGCLCRCMIVLVLGLDDGSFPGLRLELGVGGVIPVKCPMRTGLLPVI